MHTLFPRDPDCGNNTVPAFDADGTDLMKAELLPAQFSTKAWIPDQHESPPAIDTLRANG